MLHAKFQDHRTSGSGEDFTIYGYGSHLCHGPEPFISQRLMGELIGNPCSGICPSSYVHRHPHFQT